MRYLQDVDLIFQDFQSVTCNVVKHVLSSNLIAAHLLLIRENGYLLRSTVASSSVEIANVKRKQYNKHVALYRSCAQLEPVSIFFNPFSKLSWKGLLNCKSTGPFVIKVTTTNFPVKS